MDIFHIVFEIVRSSWTFGHDGIGAKSVANPKDIDLAYRSPEYRDKSYP